MKLADTNFMCDKGKILQENIMNFVWWKKSLKYRLSANVVEARALRREAIDNFIAAAAEAETYSSKELSCAWQDWLTAMPEDRWKRLPYFAETISRTREVIDSSFNNGVPDGFSAKIKSPNSIIGSNFSRRIADKFHSGSYKGNALQYITDEERPSSTLLRIAQNIAESPTLKAGLDYIGSEAASRLIDLCGESKKPQLLREYVVPAIEALDTLPVPTAGRGKNVAIVTKLLAAMPDTKQAMEIALRLEGCQNSDFSDLPRQVAARYAQPQTA